MQRCGGGKSLLSAFTMTMLLWRKLPKLRRLKTSYRWHCKILRMGRCPFSVSSCAVITFKIPQLFKTWLFDNMLILSNHSFPVLFGLVSQRSTLISKGGLDHPLRLSTNGGIQT